MWPGPGSRKHKASVLSWPSSSVGCWMKKQGSPSRRYGCRRGRLGSTGPDSRSGKAEIRSIPPAARDRCRAAAALAALGRIGGRGDGDDLLDVLLQHETRGRRAHGGLAERGGALARPGGIAARQFGGVEHARGAEED